MVFDRRLGARTSVTLSRLSRSIRKNDLRARLVTFFVFTLQTPALAMGGRRRTTNNLPLLQVKHQSEPFFDSESTSSSIMDSLDSRFDNCHIFAPSWALHNFSSSRINIILSALVSWTRHSFCDFASSVAASNHLPETPASI